jgi:hypothetical protein
VLASRRAESGVGIVAELDFHGSSFR